MNEGDPRTFVVDKESQRMLDIERDMARLEGSIADRDREAHTGSGRWVENFRAKAGPQIVPTKSAR